jgi:hypothetical protein
MIARSMRSRIEWSSGHRMTVILALLFVALTGVFADVHADEPDRRIDIGLALRFMPTGRFQWTGRAPGASSDLHAYPALGGAPFVDYRLNAYTSIGFMPDLTLNVIPKVDFYPISAILAGSLRLKAQYPGWHFIVPYVLLAPGYSAVIEYGNAGGSSGNAHGFVLSAYSGTRIPIVRRHSIVAEAGYMRGFQRSSDRNYSPSYLVLGLGWQVSL